MGIYTVARDTIWLICYCVYHQDRVGKQRRKKKLRAKYTTNIIQFALSLTDRDICRSVDNGMYFRPPSFLESHSFMLVKAWVPYIGKRVMIFFLCKFANRTLLYDTLNLILQFFFSPAQIKVVILKRLINRLRC